MSVECNGVSGKQPYKLSVCENDLAAGPDRFEEEVEAARDSLSIRWLALEEQAVLRWCRSFLDKEPEERRCGEEDWCDDEGEVVAEVRNQS